MGLDIYVGTFTRYYQRDWKTIVQQFPDARMIRSAGDTQTRPHPEEIRLAVAEWSSALAAGLGLPSLSSEDAAAPYFTDKPAWDGYGALVLWGAYDDQEINPRSRTEAITTENWSHDPALKRYQEKGVQTRYPQLLLGEEIWLPIPSPSVFQSVDVAGNPRMFGNAAKLAAELDLLNQRTWKADAAAGEQWRRDGCQHGSPLPTAAKFGWAVMQPLTNEAVRHNLPIILDY